MSQSPIQILWIGTIHQPQYTVEIPFSERVIYSRSGLPLYILKAMYLSMWTTDETSALSQLSCYQGSQIPDPSDIHFERRNGELYAIYSMGRTIPATPTTADDVPCTTIVTVIEQLPHFIDFVDPAMVEAEPQLFTPGLHTSITFGPPSTLSHSPSLWDSSIANFGRGRFDF